MKEEIIDGSISELEEDQLASGWFHFVSTAEAYPQVSAYVDGSRGYPNGLTLRGIPPGEELLVANDGSGRFMLKLATWRVRSDDIAALEEYIEAGEVSILTRAEWEMLKPEESEEL
tara:strand:- start:1905 stop:2252 length:348 start_codon:yes stop_codon:yes gene_type:complete